MRLYVVSLMIQAQVRGAPPALWFEAFAFLAAPSRYRAIVAEVSDPFPRPAASP